jgi:hypothetical protein
VHDMVATDYKRGRSSYHSFVAWILEGVCACVGKATPLV